MTDYSARAAQLQTGVRIDEAKQLAMGLDDFDDATVRQAIVCGRQDIVMLVSLANSQIAETRRLKRWVICLGILAVLCFVAKL